MLALSGLTATTIGLFIPNTLYVLAQCFSHSCSKSHDTSLETLFPLIWSTLSWNRHPCIIENTMTCCRLINISDSPFHNTICLVNNKSNNIWSIWSSFMEQFSPPVTRLYQHWAEEKSCPSLLHFSLLRRILLWHTQPSAPLALYAANWSFVNAISGNTTAMEGVPVVFNLSKT